MGTNYYLTERTDDDDDLEVAEVHIGKRSLLADGAMFTWDVEPGSVPDDADVWDEYGQPTTRAEMLLNAHQTTEHIGTGFC